MPSFADRRPVVSRLSRERAMPRNVQAASPAKATAHPARVAGTLAAACVAVLVAQIANALPASLNGLFQTDLHTTGSQLTWITAAFMIAVAAFELTFGVLGDLFGRRRLQALGAVALIIGSVVSALAPTVQVLWIGAAL